MSVSISVDPTTYTVPANQALIFSTVADSVTTYQYKLSSGSTGSIPVAYVKALGLSDTDLPALVYQTDLLKCLNNTFDSVSDPRSALYQKATRAYEKHLDIQKLNKSAFLKELTYLATKDELFTKEEMIEILQAYVGAIVVEDIASRDSLELESTQYVWVLDPTGDSGVTTIRPTLYKWNSNNNSFEFIVTALEDYQPGSIGGTYHRQLISGDSNLEYKDWVMVDTNCNVTLPKLIPNAYVAISTIGDANGVTIIPKSGDCIYINSTTSTTDGLVLYQSHSCVELFGTSKGWCISRKDGNFSVLEEDNTSEE